MFLCCIGRVGYVSMLYRPGWLCFYVVYIGLVGYVSMLYRPGWLCFYVV